LEGILKCGHNKGLLNLEEILDDISQLRSQLEHIPCVLYQHLAVYLILCKYLHTDLVIFMLTIDYRQTDRLIALPLLRMRARRVKMCSKIDNNWKLLGNIPLPPPPTHTLKIVCTHLTIAQYRIARNFLWCKFFVYLAKNPTG
jgi:hypothetical protein